MKRIRVALVSTHFAEYVSLLARALAETCEVLLVLRKENVEADLGESSTAWGANVANLTVVEVPKPRSALEVVDVARRIRAALKSFRPEIVHCQEGGSPDEIIASLFPISGYPIVLTVHDPSPHSGRDARRLRFSRHRLYRALLRRTAKFAIVHGEQLRRELATQEPGLASTIASVPHGPLGDLTWACGDWTPGRLLFFGRMHEYKGLRYFIEGVELAAQRGIPVRGIVAGSGGDLDKHRDKLTANPLFEVHDRYVSRDEARDLFCDANAVVMPYTDGTQSGVAAMALGYGRPVIATNVGSIPELVRNEVTGLLVPPRDVAALSVAIARIVEDQMLARRMAKDAKALAEGELSWRSIARMTLDVYGRALND